MHAETTTLPNRLSRTAPRPKMGIVHLGPGAFFRAFNAIYTDEAMGASGGDWGILAVSLKSPTARDQLAPQGGAYHAVELGPEGQSHRVIGAITDVLVAPENPQKVLEAMCDPAVKIVSLTVTEKGYCHEPATGRLRMDDPGIQHDLAHTDAPITAAGFLVEALARRKASGLRPFTVMSCDNLPDNGRLARGFILDFARARDAKLARWIEAEGCFPSTMVDRITPATTDADLANFSQSTGIEDQGCVFHEPFRQWVIEDDFVNGERPDWRVGGAQFVQDVSDHEAMKLRCLNGTHSALAYLGYLAGHETIAQTVADTPFAKLCEKLWRAEILPTLSQPEGEDLDAYCASLLNRYRNPAIRHRTWQIAMDGSQKLPQRLLGTVADNLSSGRDISGLALAVAGWMRYVGAVDDGGVAIDVRDPLSAPLKIASDSGETPADKVRALLAFDQVFPPDLALDPAFRTPLIEAYEGLVKRGAREMVEAYSNA